MAENRLSPPIIDTSLPSFYLERNNTNNGVSGATIAIPYQMNNSVNYSSFTHFILQIRNIATESVVCTLTTTNRGEDDQIAVFSLTSTQAALFTEGQYYKAQLSYGVYNAVTTSMSIGYYTTSGIIKCISKPTVSILNCTENVVNLFASTYTGIYDQSDVDDYSEKVEQYKFTIYDNLGSLFYTTDWQIHNPGDDEALDESYDTVVINASLKDNTAYTIQYSVKTTNNLEISSPKYKVITTLEAEFEEDIDVIATSNIYEGYIAINLKGAYKNTTIYEHTDALYSNNYAEDNYGMLVADRVNLFQHKDGEDVVDVVSSEVRCNGSYLLSRSSSVDDYANWIELERFKLMGEKPSSHIFYDYTVEQGVYYKYSLQQYNANNVYSIRKYSDIVFADFEDAYLYDGVKSLKIRFNPKMSSFKTDLAEAKVETIGSQYPYIFKNGNIQYKEFPLSGLISYQMDTNGSFCDYNIEYSRRAATPDSARSAATEDEMFLNNELNGQNITRERQFKLQVLDWLNNGEIKLFRSPTEGNYLVRLMNVSLAPNDTLGRMLHTFTCTAYEIAECSYKNLVKYGIVTASSSASLTTRMWRSINLIPQKASSISGSFYSIDCSGFAPGDMLGILISGNEEMITVVVGSSGTYHLDFEDALINKVELLSAIENYASERLITVEYTGEENHLFDLTSSVGVNTICASQFFSRKVFQDATGAALITAENGNLINSLDVVIGQIKIGNKVKVKQIESLTLHKRDIIPVMCIQIINSPDEDLYPDELSQNWYYLPQAGTSNIDSYEQLRNDMPIFDDDSLSILQRFFIKCTNNLNSLGHYESNYLNNSFITSIYAVYNYTLDLSDMDNIILTKLSDTPKYYDLLYRQGENLLGNVNNTGMYYRFNPGLGEKDVSTTEISDYGTKCYVAAKGMPTFSLVPTTTNKGCTLEAPIMDLAEINDYTFTDLMDVEGIYFENGVYADCTYSVQIVDYSIEDSDATVSQRKQEYLTLKADAVEALENYADKVQNNDYIEYILSKEQYDLVEAINTYVENTLIFNGDILISIIKQYWPFEDDSTEVFALNTLKTLLWDTSVNSSGYDLNYTNTDLDSAKKVIGITTEGKNIEFSISEIKQITAFLENDTYNLKHGDDTYTNENRKIDLVYITTLQSRLKELAETSLARYYLKKYRVDNEPDGELLYHIWNAEEISSWSKYEQLWLSDVDETEWLGRYNSYLQVVEEIKKDVINAYKNGVALNSGDDSETSVLNEQGILLDKDSDNEYNLRKMIAKAAAAENDKDGDIYKANETIDDLYASWKNNYSTNYPYIWYLVSTSSAGDFDVSICGEPDTWSLSNEDKGLDLLGNLTTSSDQTQSQQSDFYSILSTIKTLCENLNTSVTKKTIIYSALKAFQEDSTNLNLLNERQRSSDWAALKNEPVIKLINSASTMMSNLSNQISGENSIKTIWSGLIQILKQDSSAQSIITTLKLDQVSTDRSATQVYNKIITQSTVDEISASMKESSSARLYRPLYLSDNDIASREKTVYAVYIDKDSYSNLNIYKYIFNDLSCDYGSLGEDDKTSFDTNEYICLQLDNIGILAYVIEFLGENYSKEEGDGLVLLEKEAAVAQGMELYQQGLVVKINDSDNSVDKYTLFIPKFDNITTFYEMCQSLSNFLQDLPVQVRTTVDSYTEELEGIEAQKDIIQQMITDAQAIIDALDDNSSEKQKQELLIKDLQKVQDSLDEQIVYKKDWLKYAQSAFSYYTGKNVYSSDTSIILPYTKNLQVIYDIGYDFEVLLKAIKAYIADEKNRALLDYFVDNNIVKIVESSRANNEFGMAIEQTVAVENEVEHWRFKELSSTSDDITTTLVAGYQVTDNQDAFLTTSADGNVVPQTTEDGDILAQGSLLDWINTSLANFDKEQTIYADLLSREHGYQVQIDEYTEAVKPLFQKIIDNRNLFQLLISEITLAKGKYTTAQVTGQDLENEINDLYKEYNRQTEENYYTTYTSAIGELAQKWLDFVDALNTAYQEQIEKRYYTTIGE